MQSLYKTIKFTFALIYKSSKLMFVALLFIQLASLLIPLMSTYIFKYLLDSLIVAEPEMKHIWIYILIYIGSIVLLQVFLSLQSLCYDTIIRKADHQYMCDLMEKMNVLPLSFIDTSKGKNLIDEVRYLKTAAINFPNYLIQTVTFFLTFAVAFAELISFHIGFSLLFLALTIPGFLSQLYFRKRSDMLRRKQAPDVRKFGYYRWLLTDAWPAKDVRMYDLTQPILQRYNEEKCNYLIANKKLDRKRLFTALITEFILRSGEIVFSLFVIVKAMQGDIGIGDVALYIGFAISATTAFQRMVGAFLYGVVRANTNMKYLFEFYEIKSDIESGENRKLDAFKSLCFEKVFFKYPASTEYVLKGTTFSINKGDKVTLVGINGSGKSTIIKLMLGLYEIESGEILINGYPMSDYDMRNVRKMFSALFQSFVQYPLSLRDNIALSDYKRTSDEDAINASLKQSGVYDELQEKLENGLDSFMTRQFDDQGTELSKGQWQKIALSRTYFKNAEILIFDEPSAALDAEAEDRIFKNFESISEGKTGIMISHRISAARMSNKILVLDGGVITESGTHDELIEKNGLYAKLYNLQKEKYTVKEGV